eukprot:ANDGO_06218.mRNA.1 hypothetical protein
MPPKKGKKGGKGKKGKKGAISGPTVFQVDFTSDEKLQRLEARIQCLERILDDRTAEVSVERAKAIEMRSKVLVHEQDLAEQLVDRKEVCTDFTRLYKARQDQLVDKINSLENSKAELLDQIELQRLALEEVKRDQAYELELKERTLEEHRKRIGQVTEDFQEMLKDTLNRLVERAIAMQNAGAGQGTRVEFENLDEVRTFMKKVQQSSTDARNPQAARQPKIATFAQESP